MCGHFRRMLGFTSFYPIYHWKAAHKSNDWKLVEAIAV